MNQEGRQKIKADAEEGASNGGGSNEQQNNIPGTIKV